MFITFIRRSVLTIVMGVLVAATAAGQAEACPGVVSVPSPITYPATTFPIELRSTDPVGPFPLAALVPFPWATIQGIWAMKLPNGTSLHFSFEVQADCNGRKFVQVLGFDQKSYRVTAEGTGLGMSNDMIVRAAMTSASSQYMVYIRQFRVPAGKATGKISTVVTIRPFDGDGSTDVHMVARKASTLTLQGYVQQLREIEKRQADRSRRLVPARP